MHYLTVKKFCGGGNFVYLCTIMCTFMYNVAKVAVCNH